MPQVFPEESNMRHALVMMVGSLTLMSGNALAAVVVTSATIDLETKETKPSVVYADADRMKVVNGETTVIYRGDLQKAWIITPSRKNYVEITPETVRQLNAQVSGSSAREDAAIAQLQQRMASMPPAQRAEMEALLKSRGLGNLPGAGAPKPPPQINFVKAGPAKTVSRMRCNMYRKMVDGAQDEDICISTLAAAGLTAADFRVLESFSNFMGALSSAPQAPRSDLMRWSDMTKAIGFQGMPLDTVHYESGMPSRQDTVQKIERMNVPANTFDLPPGLTKQEIPGPRP
jgi:hypothetical protein